MTRRAGHLFVLRGDLTRLACDAWLVPCDGEMRVEANWKTFAAALGVEFPPPRPTAAWRGGRRRAIRLEPWPKGPPQPWLVNVSARGAPASWYVEGVREFLRRAHDELRAEPARAERARPLVALPVVGTRLGGASGYVGHVLAALMPVLREGVSAGLDVALVTYDKRTFAAAQTERRRGPEPWASLSPELRASARALASRAVEGELVVFMGAGVGAGAGLPSWRTMIAELAAEAHLSAEEQSALDQLPMLDRASFIESRLGGGQYMRQRIATRLDHHHATLAHHLLADLPVAAYVTTNYDRLFERTCEGLGEALSILPHRPLREARRWLLKMHGCITRPEDIVLTREDYLRYEERRAALAGIVQALLITRHMLFVGFSLSDENFRRIAGEVRRAAYPQGGGAGRGAGGRGGARDGAGARHRLGTILTLGDERIMRELWASDLAFMPMTRGQIRHATTRVEAARRLEIFLDCLLAHAGPAPSHLLDERYSGVLTGDERQLSEALRGFMATVPAHARHGPAWHEVRMLLRRLGARI